MTARQITSAIRCFHEDVCCSSRVPPVVDPPLRRTYSQHQVHKALNKSVRAVKISYSVDSCLHLTLRSCRVMNKNAIVNCRWTVRPVRSDGQSLPGKDGKEVSNMDYVYFEQVREPRPQRWCPLLESARFMGHAGVL